MRISDWRSDVCSADLGAQPVVQGADEDRGAAQARERGVVPRPQPGGVGRVTSGSGGRSQTARHHRRGTARAWRRWRRDPSGPTTVRRESPGRFAFPGKEFPMAWFYLLLAGVFEIGFAIRSEEHTSELQSLMRISYAVF